MKHSLLIRHRYLDKLIQMKDVPLIKAIVGIRRCGKSTLMGMYRDYLLSTGISEESIVSLNLSHGKNSELNPSEIMAMVSSVKGRTYVLLDEVQIIENWDRMVLEMLETKDCDIYITGSNSVMFSSKLTTLLSGRSVTMEMFPFSYSEFLEYTELKDSVSSITEYMTYGGFPLALLVRDSRESETAVLEGIYNTVVLKEIVQKYKVRNQQMLERISQFLMRNIGSPISVKSIRDYMTGSGIKVNFETVDSYLGYLEESLAFYRVKRYDMKAKEELVINDKFYLSDLGLRTAILGRRDVDIGHLMENIVYLELRRRGYKIYTGKSGDHEIDFVAMGSEDRLYIQVCYSLRDPSTEERELRPLKSIKDDYRKIIIVMEESVNTDRNGIKEILLSDFLTQKIG
ncbi:MAG: ATP-binding protein [Candidatus Methanomethylophilaceae archaeon]|nr:ATP-binding protein [Candidatus Methanomethylophilaceae archaeon]